MKTPYSNFAPFLGKKCPAFFRLSVHVWPNSTWCWKAADKLPMTLKQLSTSHKWVLAPVIKELCVV